MEFVSSLLLRSNLDAGATAADVSALYAHLTSPVPSADSDTHRSRLPLHLVVPRASVDESHLLFARLLGQLRLEAARAGKPRWCLIVEDLDDAAWSTDDDERRLCIQLVQSLFSALSPPAWPDEAAASSPPLPSQIVCIAPVVNAPPPEIRALFRYEVDVRGQASLAELSGVASAGARAAPLDAAHRLLRRQAEHIVALANAGAASATAHAADADSGAVGIGGAAGGLQVPIVYAALQRGSSAAVSEVPTAVVAAAGVASTGAASLSANSDSAAPSAWLSDPANADLLSAPYVRGAWDFTAPAAAEAASTYLPRVIPRLGDAAEDAASAAEAAATSSAAVASASAALLARSPPSLPPSIARAVERAHPAVLCALLSRVAGGRATLQRLGISLAASDAPSTATSASVSPVPVAAAAAPSLSGAGGVLLVGPSACGKSTLARHFCALARAASVCDALADCHAALVAGSASSSFAPTGTSDRSSEMATSGSTTGLTSSIPAAVGGGAQAAVPLTAFVRLADILRSGVGESEAQLQAVFAAARAYAAAVTTAGAASASASAVAAGAASAAAVENASVAPALTAAATLGPAHGVGLGVVSGARVVLVFDDAHALFPRRRGGGAGGSGGRGGDDNTAKVWSGLAAVMRRCLDDAARDGVLVLAIAQSEDDVEHTLLAQGRLGMVLRL